MPQTRSSSAEAKAARLLGSRPSWLSYAFAVVLTLSTVGLRRMLETFGEGVVPFALFLPVVLVCTLFGGAGPGLLSLAVATLAVWSFWLQPGLLIGLSATGLVNFLIFASTAAALISVALFLRSTLRGLRLSEARLEAAFGSVPAAIAAIDRDGKVVIANERFLSLFPAPVIPSRDPEQVTRWRGWDAEGHQLDPADFPGARALRGEIVIPGQEMIYIDQAGSELWYSMATVPTHDPQGELSGFVTAITDIGESKANEAALRESEKRLQTLMSGIPQLVWRASADGKWTWASPQWEEMVGLSSVESFGDGWLDALHPEDRAAAQEAWMVCDANLYLEFECRVQDVATGEYRWFQTRALPVIDEGGAVLEWLGTCTDMHELRELQERHRVLIAELQHRTRNLIALVSSMCDRTARSSRNYAEFDAKFRDRLGAMARTQGLLSRLESHDRVTFNELLETELTAIYGAETHGKVSLSGPHGMRLRSSAVQTLAMALHELATNALKYGALSQASARLEVSWTLESGGGDNPGKGETLLRINWRERGVQMPAGGAMASGQGRELIERALPYQLGARTAYQLGPDGVNCTIWIEVSKKPDVVEGGA